MRCSSTVSLSKSTLCCGHSPRLPRTCFIWVRMSNPFMMAVPPVGGMKPGETSWRRSASLALCVGIPFTKGQQWRALCVAFFVIHLKKVLKKTAQLPLICEVIMMTLMWCQGNAMLDIRLVRSRGQARKAPVRGYTSNVRVDEPTRSVWLWARSLYTTKLISTAWYRFSAYIFDWSECDAPATRFNIKTSGPFY